MAYFLLMLIPLATASTKIFQKKYKNNSTGIRQASNIYIFINCLTAMIFFAIMAGGKLVPNIPTLIYSLFLAFFAVLSALISLVALDKTDIVNITVFSSAGGIAIPFLYGIVFLKEPISILKAIACILLIAVVVLPLFNKKINKKTSLIGYVLCLILFFESGAATILFKLYAMAENVMDTNVFCFWGNAVMIPYLLLTSLRGNTASIASDIKKIDLKTYLFAVLSVIASNCTTLFGVWVLKEISITVYTLLNSSLTLIFTAFLSRIIFSEKITKQMAISIILSITAIVCNTI